MPTMLATQVISSMMPPSHEKLAVNIHKKIDTRLISISIMPLTGKPTSKVPKPGNRRLQTIPSTIIM
jgi:hypothetical protein